ncbi:MAG: YggT family protein [Patescibacteria group bacterium]
MREKIPKMLAKIIHLILWLLESFLVMRLVLRLFGANAEAVFVKFIYQVSDAILTPFQNTFPVQEFNSKYVLDFSALFAIIIYALVAYFLLETIYWMAGVSAES